MIVKLYVKFSTWLDFTVRRCRDGDEASRIARMVSALLGWLVTSYALEATAAFVLVAVVKQGSMPEAWAKPLSALSAVIAACLAYPIIVWGIPGMRDALFGDGNWLRAPEWGEAARKLGVGRLGKWATLVVGAVGAVACFLVVQGAGLLSRLALGDVSIASTSTADAVKGVGSGDPMIVVAGVLSLLFTIALAPMLEEAVFRGLVVRDVVGSVFASKPDGTPSRARQVAACVLASLVFGLLHVVTIGDWRAALSTAFAMTCMGSVLALEARAAKSVWPTMVSHVLYNVVTLVLLVVLA